MIKLMIFVKRNPNITHAEFRQHLSVNHAKLVRDCPASAKYIRKYVQNYRADPSDDAAPFDGAVELWFDSKEDMDTFYSHPQYLNDVQPDEPRFADLSKCIFLATEEAQII